MSRDALARISSSLLYPQWWKAERKTKVTHAHTRTVLSISVCALSFTWCVPHSSGRKGKIDVVSVLAPLLPSPSTAHRQILSLRSANAEAGAGKSALIRDELKFAGCAHGESIASSRRCINNQQSASDMGTGRIVLLVLALAANHSSSFSGN